jgi:hypothetical protein
VTGVRTWNKILLSIQQTCRTRSVILSFEIFNRSNQVWKSWWVSLREKISQGGGHIFLKMPPKGRGTFFVGGRQRGVPRGGNHVWEIETARYSERESHKERTIVTQGERERACLWDAQVNRSVTYLFRTHSRKMVTSFSIHSQSCVTNRIRRLKKNESAGNVPSMLCV